MEGGRKASMGSANETVSWVCTCGYVVVIAVNELSLMQRLEKEVRIGYGRGKRGNVSVVREHYLRDDIPCKSEACVLCGKQIAPGYLEGAWSHLIYRP